MTSPTQLVTVKIESVDNDGNMESATELRRNGPLRQLQVKLTRLPTSLLKLFIKKPYGNNSLEADPDLGLHTELDIKWEPEGELKEEPQDCGVDFVLATDDDGGPSSDERELKRNRSSATPHQIVEHSDVGTDYPIPFKDADTGSSNSITSKKETSKIKQQTQEVTDVNKHVTTNTTDNSIVVPNDVHIDGKLNSHLGNKKPGVNNDYDIHAAEVHSCNTCKYITNTEKLLKFHIKAHSAVKKYTCDTCCYIATTKNKLICHIRQHTDVKPFDCEICSKELADKKSLKIHMRTHTGETHACEICDKNFKQSLNLKIHYRIHTGEKPFSCKMCDKKFSQIGSLNYHIRTHTGEKPYACEICDKKFSYGHHLKTHIRIHTGEKPYACEICDRKFNQRNNLNTHIRTHTGEKPYSCTICNKTFSKISHLNVHIRTHTGEKPHACSICSKKFIDKTTLNKHINTHTGEKPYTCQICDSTFLGQGEKPLWICKE